MGNRLSRTLAVSLLALAPAVAHAGPPLLCFPMETGGAPSLPWAGTGWNEARPDYDRSRLAADTLALLGPTTPVLARMETLRRAVLYAKADAASASRLFAALRERVGRRGDDTAAALARFDLGYAVEAAKQVLRVPAWGTAMGGAVKADEDGLALVRQAIEARGGDPEMDYAAALVTASSASRRVSDEYLRRAVARATAGSPLALTIAAHRHIWGDRVPAPATASR